MKKLFVIMIVVLLGLQSKAQYQNTDETIVYATPQNQKK